MVFMQKVGSGLALDCARASFFGSVGTAKDGLNKWPNLTFVPHDALIILSQHFDAWACSDLF